MKNQLDEIDKSDDFMRKEYIFDYSKGSKGKYARQTTEQNGYIKLLPEVQKVFIDSESVNNALLAIMHAIPKTRKRAIEKV